MINKMNKIKSVIIMLIVSAMMFTLGFAFSANPQSAGAEGTAAFTMADIELRSTTPAGLRFKTVFNGETKAEIEAADEFGFIIAPASYFEDAQSTDYLADGVLAAKIVSQVEVDKILGSGADEFYTTAVLYNILDEKLQGYRTNFGSRWICRN